MPAMGPGVNQEEVDRALQDVLSLLKSKYNIQSHEPPFMKRKMLALREKHNNHLRAALHAIFLQDACETF